MKIRILAIGTRMPAWVVQAYKDYSQRMPPVCRLELVELAAKKRSKNSDIVRILRDEAEQLRNAIPESFLVIALDRRGVSIDTESLARKMQSWIDQSQDVAILIGGPEGIDPGYLDTIATKWSLSELTFAHPLVRVLLAEQLYRAWSINANLPYHRGG